MDDAILHIPNVTPQEAYERGRSEGRTAATLEMHETHLRAIDLTLEKMAAQLAQTSELLRQMEESIRGDRETREKVAVALHDAEEKRWTPRTRLYMALSSLATVVMAAIALAAVLIH